MLALDRRAKLLLFRLDGGPHASCLHLKIAGQLVFATPDGRRAWSAATPTPCRTSTCRRRPPASCSTSGPPGTLYVNDQRRFAWLRLLPWTRTWRRFLAEQRYGPDPLDPAFTPEVLAARLAARRGRPLKAALLDQTCIAGLGNIYADESLHGAGLHPMRRAGDLDPAEVRSACTAPSGASWKSPSPSAGALVDGSGRRPMRRAGTPGATSCAPTAGPGELCPDCAGGRARWRRTARRRAIVRQFLAGRGTYFCPVCQPARPASTPPSARGASRRSPREGATADVDGTILADRYLLTEEIGTRRDGHRLPGDRPAHRRPGGGQGAPSLPRPRSPSSVSACAARRGWRPR